MIKKANIVSRALQKLKIMQKQLAEESRVLDELKEKEDADECELEGLRSELNAKTGAFAALNEELKKQRSEKEKLEAGLGKNSAELKAALDKLDALKEDYGGRQAKLDELNASNQRLLRSLREKEEIYKSEIETAKAETAAKEALTASLGEELRKRTEENGNLSRELTAKSAEFKTALDKERADFRLNCEKMSCGAAEAEKLLLREVEEIKDTLRHKDAEAARASTEIKSLLSRLDALKEDYAGRQAKLDELNASNQRLLRSLREKEEIYKSEIETAKAETAAKEALAASLGEELRKRTEENGNLSRELTAKSAEFKTALDKERADFRLNCEKMSCGAAEAEKLLLREIEALKDTLRHKETETAGKETLAASLGEELKKLKEDNTRLSRELLDKAGELKAARDKHATLKEDDKEQRLKLDELNASNQRLLRSLREKEGIYKSEIETAKAETAAKEALAASLGEELKKLKEDNTRLSRELMDKAGELKAALDKERADFRLNYEKMSCGAAEAEKLLLREIEALKDTLRHKETETAAKETLAASLGEELKKLKEDNTRLSRELLDKTGEFKAALDKERADFRLDHEKLGSSAAEAEKLLLREIEALKDTLRHKETETAAKEALAASLGEELKKLKEDNTRLSRELLDKAGELKAALDKERADFRLNYEKMGCGAAEAEKLLLREIEALKDTLRHKDAEAFRANAEIKSLLDKAEALKEDYEGRLLKLEGLSATVSEEAKTGQPAPQTGIRDRNGTLKHLNIQLAKLTFELEKAREENAAIKSLMDSSLVKITEQDIFSKSAVSALKEKEEELGILKDSMETISGEMSKYKADSKRKLELLRLELEEKNRQVARLTRELDAGRSEKENLKAELEAREKKRK